MLGRARLECGIPAGRVARSDFWRRKQASQAKLAKVNIELPRNSSFLNPLKLEQKFASVFETV